LCNGAEVSRNTFADLFAVITTFFGEPSGGTVFKLPDLRGRVAVGQDDMGDLPAGRITESWADLMGGTGGVDRHRLTTSEIPSHTHTRVDATFASGAGGAFTGTFGVDADNQELTLARNTSDNTTVENKHQNLQPSMAVQWIIKF
jgi:microcystin-dependent protein